MSFTIIIPSRNAENLKACIGAVRASGCSAPIFAVDDGIAYLEWLCIYAQFQNVSGLEVDDPFCFSRNVNLGIRMAAGNDVIVMNDDALLLTPGGFDGLAAAARDPFGIVSAAVMGPSNSPEHGPHAPIIHHTARPIKGKMVPFVCVYIPRRTIDRVGLLDERFCGVYGGEDDDYCFRVRKAGLKIGVYDGCVVDHGTLKSTFRPDGKGLSTKPARDRFREIHGFEMGTR